MMFCNIVIVIVVIIIIIIIINIIIIIFTLIISSLLSMRLTQTSKLRPLKLKDTKKIKINTKGLFCLN